MSSSLQKGVKRTDGSLTCLESTDLEGKETFNCLITSPAAQSYRSRPSQLLFAALGMKAVFGRGDLRTEGLQSLSCPRSGAGKHRSHPARSEGDPRLCPKPGSPLHTCGRTCMCPLRVCKNNLFNFLVGLANRSCSFLRAPEHICAGSHLHTVGLLISFSPHVSRINHLKYCRWLGRGAGCGILGGRMEPSPQRG